MCRVLEDKWVWINKVQDFSLANHSFKSLLDKPSYNPFKFHHFIWIVPIPNKIRVFGWLLILKKLNTKDLSQKRKPFWSLSPSWCTMCRKESESINHLFLHCPVAQMVWSINLQKFKVSWSSLKILISSSREISCGGEIRRPNSCVPW